MKGNDARKNQIALEKCTFILAHARWLNIHEIVHQTRILEVRIQEGYGVRWSLGDELEFRLFCSILF